MTTKFDPQNFLCRSDLTLFLMIWFEVIYNSKANVAFGPQQKKEM